MKIIKRNVLGGINNYDPEILHRAKKVDLVTLPLDTEGTNCFNCKWIRDKHHDVAMCVNPKVAQEVSKRMCCAIWDNDKSYRPWGKIQDVLK